jgi:hypothetical protein
MAESMIRTERIVPKNEKEVLKPVPFSPYHIRELEAYLADQAREGFLLKEISANNVTFTYDKITPIERTYRILIGPSELDASLRLTLERVGWKLVGSMSKRWFEKDAVFHIFVAEDKNASDDWFWRNNLNLAPLKTARSNFYLPILLELAIMIVATYVMYNFPGFKTSTKNFFFLGGFLASFIVGLFQKTLDLQSEKAFLKNIEPSNYMSRYQAVDWKTLKVKQNWYGLRNVSFMLISYLLTFIMKFLFEV